MPSQLSPLTPSAANTSCPHSLRNCLLSVCVAWHPIKTDLSSLLVCILPVCGKKITQYNIVYSIFYYLFNSFISVKFLKIYQYCCHVSCWMRWSCFDNILTNNPNTLFIQSFRGCHCADIHPEHVHSLCCPGALWMCHLCEDITRAGGGTDALFAHPNLTFKRLKNDASLSKSTPDEIVLTFCIWPCFTEIFCS